MATSQRPAPFPATTLPHFNVWLMRPGVVEGLVRARICARSSSAAHLQCHYIRTWLPL